MNHENVNDINQSKGFDNMELLDYEKAHLSKLRNNLAECTVLLKTDGAFPLKEAGKLGLFGSGARHTIKGGTGSGEVNSRFFVTVENGLETAGFTLTSKAWLNAYDGVRENARKAFLSEIKGKAMKSPANAVFEVMGKTMPEPEYDLPLDFTGDTAVYVLARTSGEGSDREYKAGDILLTETEIRDILFLQGKCTRFLLVLNVGGPVDLTPVADKVGNILLLSQLGVETGAVLADILLGRANPSGRLTTTWASASDYPSLGDFGERDDTRYREGIYVGYRWFDSAGVLPLFPFGFGLSFTSFEINEVNTELEGETVTVSAVVRNTGFLPGKEVLQLYVSKPEEKLDQAFRDLAAFVKTKELASGEEERLTMRFRMSEIASYDSRRECWVLERGDYFLRLGDGSNDAAVVARLRLEEEVITFQTKNCCGIPDFTDWKPTLETIDMFPPDVPVLTLNPKDIPRGHLLPETEGAPDPDALRMSTEQLISMSLGNFNPKHGVLGVIGGASSTVAGAAGETSETSKEFGIPTLVMADGPAGLRLSREYYMDGEKCSALGQRIPESIADFVPKPAVWLLDRLSKKPPENTEILHQYCTAIPIGTALAQSWNTEFARCCGDIVGDEMERMHVDLWLAPAMNIHRDIRCGRNFEYFSEDPLLSGLMAAAITAGVQAHPGRGTTVKHYAANNQEYNRYNSNSQVSERAMREIYLRGFGICIRLAQPKALMTSYNLLNGIHTSEHSGLLNTILRREFGFQGLVMTDWVVAGIGSGKKNRYPSADAGRVSAAGGDLFMPGCKADAESMRKALKRGVLTENRLRRNVSRILQIIRSLKNE